jgi:molybdopterin-guanine dinucleotide biosynthesis protein A
MGAAPRPIGAVLAGGEGRRLGGSKATVHLRGRPLICYPLRALQTVLRDVVLVVKPTTELPSLPGVTVWIEPEEPRHPLLGILHALSLAEGRPALVCASDLPFVRSETIEQLASAEPHDAPAVVACAGGQIQPLLGCYQTRTIELVSLKDEAPLREVVAGIGALTLEVDERELFNVNYPEDLLQAAALLDSSSERPSRT